MKRVYELIFVSVFAASAMMFMTGSKHEPVAPVDTTMPSIQQLTVNAGGLSVQTFDAY